MTKVDTSVSRKADMVYLFAVIPAIFVFAIIGLNLLFKWAKTNSRICSFIGNIWLTGVPGDSSVPAGCFSYEELYRQELGLER